jgi:hypothetical protein
LSGGTNSASVTPNYGYPTNTAGGTTAVFGFFQMSPIIVGRGGASGGGTVGGTGGVGCGGGGGTTGDGGAGGAGMAVIISW